MTDVAYLIRQYATGIYLEGYGFNMGRANIRARPLNQRKREPWVVQGPSRAFAPLCLR